MLRPDYGDRASRLTNAGAAILITAGVIFELARCLRLLATSGRALVWIRSLVNHWLLPIIHPDQVSLVRESPSAACSGLPTEPASDCHQSRWKLPMTVTPSALNNEMSRPPPVPLREIAPAGDVGGGGRSSVFNT